MIQHHAVVDNIKAISLGRKNSQLTSIYVSNVTQHPPRRYPYFNVVEGFAWSCEPESYVGGSVCYW